MKISSQPITRRREYPGAVNRLSNGTHLAYWRREIRFQYRMLRLDHGLSPDAARDVIYSVVQAAGALQTIAKLSTAC